MSEITQNRHIFAYFKWFWCRCLLCLYWSCYCCCTLVLFYVHIGLLLASQQFIMCKCSIMGISRSVACSFCRSINHSFIHSFYWRKRADFEQLCSLNGVIRFKPNAFLPTPLNSTQLNWQVGWVELSLTDMCWASLRLAHNDVRPPTVHLTIFNMFRISWQSCYIGRLL